MSGITAIEILKGENELICFDPTTGENCIPNDFNKSCLEAHNKAISALEKQLEIIKIISEHLDCTDAWQGQDDSYTLERIIQVMERD